MELGVSSSDSARCVEEVTQARVYAAVLGSKNARQVDRDAAKRIAAKAPEIYEAALANRTFLIRATRFLALQGVRQFIDLGSGYPMSPNVHEVARQVHPDARVLYVDHDPVVASHGRALLAATEGTGFIHADIRHSDRILGDPGRADLIDLTQPIGVMAAAIVHFVDDNAAAAAVTGFRAAMAPGSYLAISHASPGTRSHTELEDAVTEYCKNVTEIWPRTPGQIEAYFAGCELVKPGLVPARRWKPHLAPAPHRLFPKPRAGAPMAVMLAGVGHVPEAGGTGDA